MEGKINFRIGNRQLTKTLGTTDLLFCTVKNPTLFYTHTHTHTHTNTNTLPNDTELALGMTLLELHYVLQVFCVRQEDGGGVNRGS